MFKRILIPALLIALLLCPGCSSNENPVRGTPSASAEVTASPAAPPSEGNYVKAPLSSTVPPTESCRTQATDSPWEKTLILTEARLHSSAESDSILLDGTIAEYAGYGWVSFRFNKPPTDFESLKLIAPYILVDGEKSDATNLWWDGFLLKLFLQDNLPENITVEILPGLATDGRELEQGFSQKLTHHPGLKVSIEPYSTETQTTLPNGIYFAGESRDFLVSFSKPMDRSSVEVSLDELQDYPIKTKWLDDNRMLVNISGLKVNDRCSFGVVGGKARDGNLFGDKIDLTPREKNTPHIYFYVKEPQSLKAVSLDSSRSRTIKTFEQGMLVEDLSPDRKKLSMGVIINDDDGYFYNKCILDLNEKDPELRMTPWRDLYNPPVAREYWTKDGTYESELVSEIMSVKSELTENLYGWRESGKLCRETLKLDNGDIAMVQAQYPTSSSSDEGIFLVHANSEGKVIKEYKLPFRAKTGEGWLLFECDIEDAGNKTLLATGYENPPYGPVSTYLIDLKDGSMRLIAQTGDLIQRFPKFGFSLYYKVNLGKLNDYRFIEVIDYEGKTIETINLPEGFSIAKAAFNPDDGRLYLFSEGAGNSLLWKSFNPETFDELSGTLQLDRYAEPIGFLDSGELLILEN